MLTNAVNWVSKVFGVYGLHYRFKGVWIFQCRLCAPFYAAHIYQVLVAHKVATKVLKR